MEFKQKEKVSLMIREDVDSLEVSNKEAVTKAFYLHRSRTNHYIV